MRCNNQSNCSKICVLSIFIMGLRVKTTTSTPWSVNLILKDSLISRFTRLRSTARGKFFLLTAMPKRPCPRPLLQHNANSPGWKNLTGFENTLLYSLGVSRRFTLVSRKSAWLDKDGQLLLCSEDFTTFGTSTIDYCSAIFRCHTATKSVSTFSLQNAWLKCSFHLWLSLHS